MVLVHGTRVEEALVEGIGAAAVALGHARRALVPEGGEASWRGLTITNPVLNGSNGQFAYNMTW